MKTLGQIRQTVRDLVRRLDALEKKVDALIDVFCKDMYETKGPNEQ